VNGVLLIDKPAGPTSHDVVLRARRALGTRDAGHTGTLDPAATGLLAVCVGDALKVQRWLVDGDKAYLATVAFGAATETEDAEGAVIGRGDPGALTAEAVRAALTALTGEIDQLPPMYSAVRVDGRRLHESARAGLEVTRAPRRVMVHALTLLELGAVGADGLRLARMEVRCGKGTYVRTLAADLGRALGVPAHLAALRRTAASGFSLDQAIPLEALERLAQEGGPEAVRSRVVPPALALPGLPEARVSPGEAIDLAHGRAILAGGALRSPPVPPLARDPDPQRSCAPHRGPAGGPVQPHPAGPALVRAVDEQVRLVAVCRVSEGRLHPVRVFVTAADLAVTARQTNELNR
jgi:tRNA pseudouridine55 synthase